MKKILPLVSICALVILLVGFLAFKNQKKQNEQGADQLPETEISQAPINQRPFVSLTPRADGHELKLTVDRLDNIRSIDYELIYLVKDLQRGVIGSMDTSGKSTASKDLLLGSCSKNVCKYDEGVTEGSLTLRLKGTGGVQKYETPFHLQKLPEAKNKLSLNETGFSFSGKLNKAVLYLTMGTVGLPSDSEKEVITGPYGIFSSDGSTLAGIANLKLSETAPSTLMGWNSKSLTWENVDPLNNTSGLNVYIQVK